MSGHSKWSTIKRQKGAEDKKRGLVFSKLANAITIAVREGGGTTDPASNFKLRLMMDKAKAANMPKDNIQRAIERAIGSNAQSFEEITFEGYAPGGIAIMIVCATDNRARTMQAVKMALERAGGTFGARGSVAYMFNPTGNISMEHVGQSEDTILNDTVESGADDFEIEDGVVEVYTGATNLHSTKEALTAKGYNVSDAEIILKPTLHVAVTDAELAKKIVSLMETLEDLEDVQKVYANFDIPQHMLQEAMS